MTAAEVAVLRALSRDPQTLVPALVAGRRAGYGLGTTERALESLKAEGLTWSHDRRGKSTVWQATKAGLERAETEGREKWFLRQRTRLRGHSMSLRVAKLEVRHGK